MLKNVPFFKKIIICFSALIICCVTIFGFINRQYVSNEMVHMVKQTNQQMLLHFQDTFDRYFFSYFDVTTQLSFSPLIEQASYLTKETKEESDPRLFKDIITYLKSIHLSNRSINNIWIHLYDSDTVINQNGMYNTELHLASYDIEARDIVKQNVDSIVPFGYQFMDGDNIVFAASIPTYKSYPHAVAYIEVNVYSLFNYINSINKTLDTPYYVMFLNSDNDIILKNSSHIDTKAIFGEDDSFVFFDDNFRERFFPQDQYVEAKIVSDNTHYSFITFVPKDYIYGITKSITKISHLLSVIQICFCILFAYFIISKLYKPVKKIIYFIEMNYDKGNKQYNDIDLINHFIEYLFKEKKQLELDFQNQHLKMQHKLLLDIVSGQIDNTTFYEKYNKDYFNFSHDGFIVLTIGLSSLESECHVFNKEILSLLNKITINDKNTASFYFFSSGIPFISCLINMDEKVEHDILDDILEHINTIFHKQNAKIEYAMGIGNLYNDFSYIKNSFKESTYVISHDFLKDKNNVIYIDEILSLEKIHTHFTLEEETKLRNLLKAGTWIDVQSFLETLLESKGNFKCTSIELMNSYFMSLVNAVIRVSHEINQCSEQLYEEDFNIYKEMLASEQFEFKYNLLFQFVQKVMYSSVKNKTSKNQELYQAIVAYIQEKYSEDISLTVLSHDLKISIPYLSHIFKQVSGELFVDYVNKYRLGKAKDLITQTDLLISEIAIKVGFLNPNSFIRVFKKYEGMTPGKFRRGCKENSVE